MDGVGLTEKSTVNANTLASYCCLTTEGRPAVHACAQHACAQHACAQLHEIQVQKCKQVP